MYSYLISSFILMVDAFCCADLDAGEIFGIFIMAKFGIIFFRIHFRLKYMLALRFHIFLFRSSYLWMCPWLVLIIFIWGTPPPSCFVKVQNHLFLLPCAPSFGTICNFDIRTFSRENTVNRYFKISGSIYRMWLWSCYSIRWRRQSRLDEAKLKVNFER
jgi:hypothetical protein